MHEVCMLNACVATGKVWRFKGSSQRALLNRLAT